MTEADAIILMRKGWANFKRATKMYPYLRERAAIDPTFSFRSKAVPDWVYYPATDTVMHTPTPSPISSSRP